MYISIYSFLRNPHSKIPTTIAMFHLLNILFLLFLIGTVHGLWVVGSSGKITSACSGNYLRHISIHPTVNSIFSAVCTSGGPPTIWKLGQSAKQVQALVDATKGSIKVLMPYYVSRKLYFAVILEPNTKIVSYWYWGLSEFEVDNKVRQSTGSITSFVPYVNMAGNRVYCIVESKIMTTKSQVFISKSPEEINARANGGYLGGPTQYRVRWLYAVQDRLFDALLVPASKPWFYVHGISEENARKKVISQRACISAATGSVDAFGNAKWAVTSELCSQPETEAKTAISSQSMTPGKGSGSSGSAATSENPEDMSPEPSMANLKSDSRRTRNFNNVSGEANSFSFSFSSRTRSG